MVEFLLNMIEGFLQGLASWVLSHPELAAVGFIGYILGKVL